LPFLFDVGYFEGVALLGMSPVMGWLAEGVALLLLLLLLFLLLCCIIKVIELQFQFAPFGTLIHSRVSVSQTPTLVHTCYSAIPIPLTHCCHPQNINPLPPKHPPDCEAFAPSPSHSKDSWPAETAD